ncbi:uncharacterized protein [Porites lutea]|uniref:uncharacterized protein n=1 Tax=Porites lutea TaxID=51062 RepID=UPI003CC529B2
MGVINFFRSIYKRKNLFISGNQAGKELNVLKKVYKECLRQGVTFKGSQSTALSDWMIHCCGSPVDSPMEEISCAPSNTVMVDLTLTVTTAQTTLEALEVGKATGPDEIPEHVECGTGSLTNLILVKCP